MKKILISAFLLLIFQSSIYSKTNLELSSSDQKRLKSLISKMTIDEKIGQLYQMAFENIDSKIRKTITNGQLGAGLNIWTVENKNKAQKLAVEKSRLRIPIIFGGDIMHGYRTIFPIPIGQAASWNPELIKKAAHIAAIEGSATGFSWTFSPMLGICRDPRWGRVEGTLGEDPYLAEVLGCATIDGYQGNNLSDLTSIAATAKHYLGYSAPQAGIESYPSFIPASQLNNIYIPPFRAAVNTGVATFMAAFSELNGIPSSGSKYYIHNILKQELNFQGFVSSDFCSIPQMVTNGYVENNKMAAYKALSAGVDMEMVSETYNNNLKTLLNEKKISMKMLDSSVERILKIKFLLGLFDHPYTNPNRKKVLLTDEHKQIARQLARESIIMLKNENNILPLGNKIKSIAIIGPLANSKQNQMGINNMDGKAEDTLTPLMSLKKNYADKITFNYVPGLKSCIDSSEDFFLPALSAAKESDLVLLFLGEEADMTGEGNNRAFLNLPGAQRKLLNLLFTESDTPIILIIMAGRPLTFDDAIPKANAILYSFFPGTMGGPALTDLLFGNYSPSGKLTITFPRAVGQIPIYYNHKHTPRPPLRKNSRKDLINGEIGNLQQFQSQYIDLPITPQFPFGFGLSYGDFKYTDLQLSTTKLRKDKTLTISITLENVGKRKAVEIVQLYIRDVYASLTRPVKELKGFKRVELKPNESKTVEFELSSKDLGFYTTEGKFVTEPGEFNVWVGENSAKGLKGTFHLLPN